jgi:hypothetical protein
VPGSFTLASDIAVCGHPEALNSYGNRSFTFYLPAMSTQNLPSMVRVEPTFARGGSGSVPTNLFIKEAS